MLRRFFSPKVRKLYIVCSHHSPNDYLSISAIRRQCVCSSKSNVRQDAHPMNRGSYFENTGWKSVKLIYKEKAVKSLICGDFINEIYYIIIKQRHYCTPKWASCPKCGQKAHTLGWNAHPLVSDPAILIKSRCNIFNYSNFIHISTWLILDSKLISLN